ncbi:hypothetical protein Tco_1542968, partial [Tanacetum coccineum]
IIMVNVIPPDHVDDVPVVEPNQHDDVPVILEPVLVDEDEDSEEEEFEEEEDDKEVDIEEDDNKPELTYPYEEVEDTVESKDETVPANVHERRLCGRDTVHALVKKKGKAKDAYYERPNEAIDVPVEDEKRPSSELRGSPRDS